MNKGHKSRNLEHGSKWYDMFQVESSEVQKYQAVHAMMHLPPFTFSFGLGGFTDSGNKPNEVRCKDLKTRTDGTDRLIKDVLQSLLGQGRTL
jgi:hypothetical protein